MNPSSANDADDETAARAATPGSYGEPPRGFRLPEDTRLGPVRLRIADLGRSLAFYQRTLGLRVLEQEGPRAVLGADDETPLVELQEHAGARPVPNRGRTGLYHFAILLPDRPSLGRFVAHLGAIDARAGSADHLVSEALYLQDPDNLGIEVYADRPRGTWQRTGRQLRMAADPLDVRDLVRAGGDARWSGMPAGTVMGHIHLHVGDTHAGAQFFSEALGFDRTVWGYPGALFFGAGGYHHHLGTNTWAGAGAKPPSADDAQLLEWTIRLPTVGSLEAAAESLSAGGHPIEDAGPSRGPREIISRDPWGTPVRLGTV
jgi:catechol 2,3-dioxygenase